MKKSSCLYTSSLHRRLKSFFGILTFIFYVCIVPSVKGQTYTVNGTALDKGAGLVRLTAAGIGNQTASAWSTTKIDLTQPFDMSFDMFFGCDNGPNGGDGMTFTFQNDPRGLSAVGDGFGYLGIGGSAALSPAISIEFDTYDGTASGGSNEIAADHIAIDINGDVNNTGNFFTGTSGSTTVQAVYGGRDLEDCAQNSSNYYTIRVVWNPAAHTLQLYEEGVLTMTYTNDVVNTIFGGNSMVYWGFTGATGSASNEQWIAPTGSIIPWQCTSNSCCTAYTLTQTGPGTVCSGSISVGVTPSSGSAPTTYNWSTGATSSTTSISAPGTYTVNVQQMQGASLCPSTLTFTIATSGGSGVMTGGGTLCNDGSTTPLSVALSGTPPWSIVYSIDGVNQTPITGIMSSPYTITATAPHVYALESVTDNSACSGAASGSATVDTYDGLPVGHDANFSAPASTTLSVDNNGGTYEWYTAASGGSAVYTGSTYNTPVLGGTTTYYVVNSAITPFTNKSVAFLNNTQYGTGGNNTQTALGLPRADLWLNFTPTTSFTFNSVNVDVNITASPQAAGTQVTVYIDDFTNGALSTSVVQPISGLATGTQSVLVPLNYNIIAGHNYRISYEGAGSAQGIMYWDFVGPRGGWTTPPATITKDPELSITVPNQGWYPGIFNWQITEGSPASSCGRTPVTAYAVAPVKLLYFNAYLRHRGVASLEWSTAMEQNNDYFTVQRSQDGIHFMDIAVINGAGNSNNVQNYQYLDEAAYSGISYYRLKQTDSDGQFSFSNIAKIDDTQLNHFTVSLFPNPSLSSSEVLLNVSGVASNSRISVSVYDLLGKNLFQKTFNNTESEFQYDLNSSINFASGTYVVIVTPDKGDAITQKLLVY